MTRNESNHVDPATPPGAGTIDEPGVHALRAWFRGTRAGKAWRRFRSMPLGLRMTNWFVHRWVYGAKTLDFSLHFTSRAVLPQRMKISPRARFSLARNGACYLQAFNGIEIGDGTIIASGVKIISSNHSLGNFSRHDEAEPIRIGRDCWLGSNCVILPGVQLGDGVIVGAGAVVTRSFHEGAVLGGVPARVIRTRETWPSRSDEPGRDEEG